MEKVFCLITILILVSCVFGTKTSLKCCENNEGGVKKKSPNRINIYSQVSSYIRGIDNDGIFSLVGDEGNGITQGIIH